MFDFQYWQQVVTQFHFIRPLWLLVFIPMFGLIILRLKLTSASPWQKRLPEHLRKALTIGDTGWRKHLPLKMLMLIMAVGIMVCAGPTWQRAASPFGEDKAALVVVLDNSQSMLQTDLAPSRLVRSKQKIVDLLATRDGGKTGLIVYAGSGHIAMPVTQDSEVFTPFLAAIAPDIMPVEGKSAASALPLIDGQLTGIAGSTVLLVSDGVSPSDIADYERYFSDRSYQLLILAAGNKSVVSRTPIDLNSLNALASATGGKLVEVTVDNSDINTLNQYVERNMQMNGDLSMPWQDMGYPLIMLVALLQLLWFRKGWLVQWCLVGALSLSFFYSPTLTAKTVSVKAEQETRVEAISTWDRVEQWWWDLWLTPDQQGQRFLDKQDYLQAAKHFSDPMRKGAAYYYATEYQLAHTSFLQAKTPFGLFNAANSLARQREYVAARTLFQSLSEDESLDETLRIAVLNNLSVVNGIIDEVNRMSESQGSTPEGPEESFELGDKPQTGDGAEEKTTSDALKKESLNASEILGSDDLANKWLKKVEADPKYFLRAKFQLQLRNGGVPPVSVKQASSSSTNGLGESDED